MDWTEVEKERKWREDLYLGDDTPLSPESRARFRRLLWFPLDERFLAREVRFQRYPTPRPGNLPATGDDAVDLLETGVFEFELNGHSCRLLGYEPAPGEADEAYILIPFKDATSAEESYGGGRYLDVEPNEADVYDLDFNRCYHPYCAYDDAWTCTLPPPANHLAFRIEAGERV